MNPMHDRPIAYQVAYAKVAGSVAGGVFLSQAVYWARRMGWKEFYKTAEEWRDETALTRREFDGARTALKELGILHESLKGIPARLHYRIDIEELDRRISQFAHPVQTSLYEAGNPVCTPCANKPAHPVQTITETTQETTQEKGRATAEPPLPTPNKRGTRIPQDWQPDFAIAHELGISREQAQWEADNFRDYWTAMPGQKATKLDWLATWRTWLRRSIQNGRSKSKPAPRHRNALVEAADRLEREVILARGGDPERESFDGMLSRLWEGGPGRVHGGDAGVVRDVPRTHPAGGGRPGDWSAVEVEVVADDSRGTGRSRNADASGTREGRPGRSIPRPSRSVDDAED